MKIKQSEISDNYQVGDVCIFRKAEEGHPRVFTTHKVDMDYGLVYYYKLDGVEE
jgi:predicted amino acid racemase